MRLNIIEFAQPASAVTVSASFVGYVAVGNLMWAKVGIATPGMFAEEEFAYADVRFTWPQATDPTHNGLAATGTDGSICPVGWRMPTVHDYYALAKATSPSFGEPIDFVNNGGDATPTAEEYITGSNPLYLNSFSGGRGWSDNYNGTGIAGEAFVTANGTLFFPAHSGGYNHILAATEYDADDAFMLDFNFSHIYPTSIIPKIGYTCNIRCVQDAGAMAYNVNVVQSVGGATIASVEQANAGDVVAVSASPIKDYVFKGWTLSGGSYVAGYDANSNPTKFTMPAGSVMITPTYYKIGPPAVNPVGQILVGSIYWARTNVGSPGAFLTNEYAYDDNDNGVDDGPLVDHQYSWNEAMNPTANGFSATGTDGSICPTGWRLPTVHEWYALVKAAGLGWHNGGAEADYAAGSVPGFDNTSAYTAHGIYGADYATPNGTLFIAASGVDGGTTIRGAGYALSSTEYGGALAFVMGYDGGAIYPANIWPKTSRMSVRCVRGLSDQEYSVIVAAAAGGVAEAAASFAEAGDEMTVRATPAAGHAFQSWSLSAGASFAAGYSAATNPTKVKVPAQTVVITPSFAALNYAVNITAPSPAGGGSASASPTSAHLGEEVTLTATPNAGYTFSSWSVLDTANNGVTIVGGYSPLTNPTKFLMPARDAYVTPSFAPITYTITPSIVPVAATAAPYSVSIAPAAVQGTIGQTVTFTASTPGINLAASGVNNIPVGYFLEGWRVSGGPTPYMIAGNPINLTFSTYDLNIAAIYSPVYRIRFTVDSGITLINGDTQGGVANTTILSAKAGDVKRYSAEVDPRYNFTGFTTNSFTGAVADTNPDPLILEFEMPQSNMTISATATPKFTPNPVGEHLMPSGLRWAKTNVSTPGAFQTDEYAYDSPHNGVNDGSLIDHQYNWNQAMKPAENGFSITGTDGSICPYGWRLPTIREYWDLVKTAPGFIYDSSSPAENTYATGGGPRYSISGLGDRGWVSKGGVNGLNVVTANGAVFFPATGLDFGLTYPEGVGYFWSSTQFGETALVAAFDGGYIYIGAPVAFGSAMSVRCVRPAN